MINYCVPKGWPSLTLGQLTETTRPICYGVLKPGESDSRGVPLIRVTDIASNQFDDSSLMRIKPSLDEEFRRSRLKGGELLLSIQGTIGRVAICPEHYSGANISRTIAVIDPDARVDRRFIYFFLRYLGDTSAFHTVGTTRSSLNIESLRRVSVPVPLLSEQQRIAQILDKADALRARRSVALAQLDSLTQSIFFDMFGDPTTNPKGWPILPVGQLAEVQGGLQVTSARSSLPREAPYLRVANVHRGALDLREIKRIRATDDEIARTTLVRNDLLIVEGHGNPAEIGRCAMWDGSIGGCVHQNHLIRARFAHATIEAAYACEYVNSAGGRQHLLRAGKTTSGLNTICVSDVRTTPIAVPPRALQQEFVRRLVKLQQAKEVQRTSLAETDALFEALLHRAFRGELLP